MIHSKKLLSVLTVAVLVTVGMSAVFMGGDESEAVTYDTPVERVDVVANTVTTSSYTVGMGTTVLITAYNQTVGGVDIDAAVQSVTSTYGSGDTAGLTLYQSGTLSGTINKATSGTVTISTFYRDSDGTDNDYVITLNVVDITSSAPNPYRGPISMPANVFAHLDTTGMYVNVGTSVSITSAYTHIYPNYAHYWNVVDVTSGYGLSVTSGTLTGTITDTGNITVEVEQSDGGDSNIWTVTIHVQDYDHADVRMIGGETWTYTPTTNMTSVLSISGTATSWVSLTSGMVSGTAPTNTSVGQTYDLTITANTVNPSQTVTQTVTFTVDPQITLTAPASYTVQFGTDTSNVLGSNFEDGTRNIYSITGGTATGFTVNAATGVLGWDNPAAGTITFTATSPYTYTSGATNTATATVDVTVTGILTASVSGTLYLVTGKVVPNTPAEAVTLNHNDVGSGTYTWAVVGTNTSGVTVASDGTLGGTPGNVGTYTVTVRCTSVVGSTTQTADTTLNIVIVQVLAFTSSPSSGTIR